MGNVFNGGQIQRDRTSQVEALDVGYNALLLLEKRVVAMFLKDRLV